MSVHLRFRAAVSESSGPRALGGMENRHRTASMGAAISALASGSMFMLMTAELLMNGDPITVVMPGMNQPGRTVML